jgi:uncharacterized protein YbdZ (MbtH family)
MDGGVDAEHYQVVHTASGTSTIWPLEGILPVGWRVAGMVGSKAECFDAINRSGSQRRLPLNPKRRGEGFWRILPVHRQTIGAFLAGEDLR